MTELQSTDDRVSGLHDQASYWIGRLQAEMHGLLEHRLATHGVTVAQWGVLIALYKAESNTVRGLAAFLNVDGGAVTRLIDRLEGKGLVNRRIDRADRRSVILSLTEAGRSLAPLLAQTADAHDAQVLAGLGEAERQRFMKTLARLLVAQGIDVSGQAFEDRGARVPVRVSTDVGEAPAAEKEENGVAKKKDKKGKPKDLKKDKKKGKDKDKKSKKDKSGKKSKKKKSKK